MTLQETLNLLNQKLIEFQDVAKRNVFLLSKINFSAIKSKNETDVMKLSMGLYFLRNCIKEILDSKIKLKDFNIFQQNIKRFFQKFIDTPELINFDKGKDLFEKLNTNDSISTFYHLFCSDFKEKINMNVIQNICSDMKSSLNNFNNFKEKFKECDSKIREFITLKEKFEIFQKLINNGNLKKLNETNMEDFRFFRSFYPLNVNSEYVIDIKNNKIIQLLKK